jgi:hypothetical protein
MMNKKPEGGLAQRQAEQLARMLNLAFNNTSVYGGNHPTTQKSVVDLMAVVDTTLESLPSVTLILERDFLYFDQWRIDTKFNAAKLISLFKKVGVQSVTFERDASVDGLRVLFYVFSQSLVYNTVDMMKDELNKQAVPGIRLNYVTYQKITADEAVIAKGEKLDVDPSVLKEVNVKEKLIKEFSRIMSLKDLLQSPESVANTVLASVQGEDALLRSKTINQLRDLGRQIEEGTVDGKPLSAEEMMASVQKLKNELLQGIRVQQSLGQIMKEEDVVLGEVDRMTYQVIVQMVKDEYKAKGITVKRLAQIIRRMLPEAKDLKKLLPQLKQGLIAEGMPLADFLQLLQELQNELSSDSLIEALERGAGNIGLSVDELVDGIKENPEEAARLVVLASEIRHGGAADQFELTKILGDYVESVSSRMAIETAESATPGRGQNLEKIVTRMEKQLLGRLKEHGISEEMAKEIDTQLAERFQKTLAQLKTDWLIKMVASGRDISDSNLMRIMDAIVEQEIDLNIIHEQLRLALLAKGYTPDRVDKFLEQARIRVTQPRESAAAPPAALSVNNTMFFLKHQVGMCRRYHNPFSSLLITITAVETPEGRRAASVDELQSFISQAFTVMTKNLRDLDLLGSLGTLERYVPFIILPMTPEQGAYVVKNRLDQAFREATFSLNGIPCRLHMLISVASFDPASYPDFATYVVHVKECHKAAAKGQLS